jgi:hypothetical protein
MSRLATRFSMDNGQIKQLIEEAHQQFVDIFSGPGAKGSLSIYYVDVDPVFTVYIFDHQAVLTLYSHQRNQVDVPAFVLDERGSLYRFVREDFDSFLNPDASISRQVHPTASNKSASG